MPRFSSSRAVPALPERSRMAGQLQGPKAGIVSKLVKPWVDTKPSDVPHLPSSTMYLGATEAEYLADAHDLKLDIQRRVRGTNDERTALRQDLVQYHGLTNEEALKTMEDAVNNRTDPLRQVAYGVPAAQADEQISKTALLFDGWDKVDYGNGDPVEGTDLVGYLNGDVFNIDAQSRLTRDGSLNIDLMQRLNNVDGAMNALMSGRNTAVGYNKVMKDMGGHEGKLMQTIDYEGLRHTKHFDENRHDFNKDLLITANRRAQALRGKPVAGPDGHIRDFQGFHGTYNRTLPSYIDNIDLNALRNDVFSAHASNLPGGMRIRPRGNGITLNVPVEQLNKYQFGDKDMSDDVFKGLIARERASRS